MIHVQVCGNDPTAPRTYNTTDTYDIRDGMKQPILYTEWNNDDVIEWLDTKATDT